MEGYCAILIFIRFLFCFSYAFLILLGLSVVVDDFHNPFSALYKDIADHNLNQIGTCTAHLNNPARRVGRGFHCSRQDFSHRAGFGIAISSSVTLFLTPQTSFGALYFIVSWKLEIMEYGSGTIYAGNRQIFLTKLVIPF